MEGHSKIFTSLLKSNLYTVVTACLLLQLSPYEKGGKHFQARVPSL